MNKKYRNKGIPSKNILYEKFCKLENNANIIYRISKIRNVLLSSGAYSISNTEKQNANFERLNVPQWERDIISNSWDFTTKYSHKLLKELDILIKEMGDELN